MVTMMKNRFLAEFARAMRNFRYERTEAGVFFPAQKAAFGGFFSTSVDSSAWQNHKNIVALEGLDAQLSCFFNNGAPPTAFYLAPFTNNVAPTSALTAATFAAVQGEYTGYVETTRQPWVCNGNSVGQTVSSSNSPAVFTIGATAANLLGGALIATASAKGATTGKLIAAAMFSSPNGLSPGSTFSLKYSIGAIPKP
jgi:hypothetical protein